MQPTSCNARITTSNSAFAQGRRSLDKSLHMRLKTLLATLFSGSIHTSHMWSDLSSDMHRRMWTTCPRMCPCASQWNRLHSDTCQRTFGHNVTSLHALNIDVAGGHADFVGAHVSECFHTRTHVQRQIARWVEQFASGCASTIRCNTAMFRPTHARNRISNIGCSDVILSMVTIRPSRRRATWDTAWKTKSVKKMSQSFVWRQPYFSSCRLRSYKHSNAMIFGVRKLESWGYRAALFAWSYV